MTWLMIVVLALIAVYLVVGFLWGSFLNALTASAGDQIQPWAVLHGLFWPISLLWISSRT